MDSITIDIDSKIELKNRYLSFLKHGGILVDYQSELSLGQTTNINIKLWEGNDALQTEAKVVWIASPTTNTPKFKGYGVEFTGENADNTRKKLEIHLAGSL